MNKSRKYENGKNRFATVWTNVNLKHMEKVMKHLQNFTCSDIHEDMHNMIRKAKQPFGPAKIIYAKFVL